MFPNGDGLIDNLSPQAEDPTVLTAFNYIYPGGSVDNILISAQTVIGNMSGPNGQAIVYADGHVRWHLGHASGTTGIGVTNIVAATGRFDPLQEPCGAWV